ncbi:1630_t:CDS:1, partial [Funneliformis geosporum]
MKSLLFISLPLFLAGLGTASKHATKSYTGDLPTYTAIPQSKGLPPAHGFTKGIPPIQELSKGLPPSPVHELTKGLPPKDDVSTAKGAAPPVPTNPIDAIGSLTPECQAALFSIVANPEFFKCVPIAALLPLVPILTDPTALPTLLKDPAKNLPPLLGPVFDGICAAPKCSDEGVATSLKALDDGCQADEKNLLIEIAT